MYNILPLRRAIHRATLAQLSNVIDWLQLPWAPEMNDRLRAALHEARRQPHAKHQLDYSIEREVLMLAASGDERAVQHIGLGLNLYCPTPVGIIAELIARLTRPSVQFGHEKVPPPPPPSIVADGVAQWVAVAAGLVRALADASPSAGRRHRGHRRGR
jgi:hypothetical protein